MTIRVSRWFPSEPKMWAWSPETHLLLQDFNNRIVPYRTESDAYQLSTDGIERRRVQEALKLWGHRDGPDGFVSAVASSLLTDHEVWIEVIFDENDRNSLPFTLLQAPGVRRTANGKLIQERPKLNEGTHEYRDKADSDIEQVELDSQRMVNALLPDRYPSQMLAKIVVELVEADASYDLTPSWVMEKMVGQRRNAPSYDPAEANRTNRLRIAQVTLPIGWTAREIYYGNNRSLGDYYYYWRELRFLQFRSSMRESAEEALRQVLTLAGARCGFKASATASGLYTPLEVEDIIREFEVGEIPFSALTNVIFEKTDSARSRQRLVL